MHLVSASDFGSTVARAGKLRVAGKENESTRHRPVKEAKGVNHSEGCTNVMRSIVV